MSERDLFKKMANDLAYVPPEARQERIVLLLERAYGMGATDMRERCARVLDKCGRRISETQLIADEIRALPVTADEEPKR